MKICNGNPLSEIKKIVKSKAEYQKVMLLFDDNVPNVEIGEVYDVIKDFCIYNQSNISEIDKNEISNGYRLIIYFCLPDSLLKCDLDRSEFINVYFLKEIGYLPCFLANNNLIDETESYLIADTSKIDFSMMASINFNLFYNYLKNLFCGQNYLSNVTMLKQFANNYDAFDCLNNMGQNSFFVDIDILKKCEIEYRDIVFVDLILIDAILMLITSVKSDNYMLVDVYKAGKDDLKLIEKFYKLYYNDIFKNILLLNFNCLYNYCLKTKQKIKEYIGFFNIDSKHIEEIIEKVKSYAKNDDDIIAYLYLYNIFNV